MIAKIIVRCLAVEAAHRPTFAMLAFALDTLNFDPSRPGSLPSTQPFDSSSSFLESSVMAAECSKCRQQPAFCNCSSTAARHSDGVVASATDGIQVVDVDGVYTLPQLQGGGDMESALRLAVQVAEPFTDALASISRPAQVLPMHRTLGQGASGLRLSDLTSPLPSALYSDPSLSLSAPAGPGVSGTGVPQVAPGDAEPPV